MNKPQLHDQPLFFTAEQLQEMDRILLHLADQLGAPLLMISDVSGRLILYRGRLSAEQSTGLSALAAGGFAASLAIGDFLGLQDRQSFQQQLLEGKVANLYILAVGEELLLSIAFTPKTTLGMVRFFSQETQKKLLHLAKEAEINREKAAEQANIPLEKGFANELTSQLDDLFDTLG